jgi:hypothetical protein
MLYKVYRQTTTPFCGNKTKKATHMIKNNKDEFKKKTGGRNLLLLDLYSE